MTEDPQNSRPSVDRIYLNAKRERVDVPQKLNVDRDIERQIRDREPRLCNEFHLLGQCFNRRCEQTYYHGAPLSDKEIVTLFYINRNQRCYNPSGCRNYKCLRGHMCPHGRSCRCATECRFVDLHDKDSSVFEEYNWSD